ncbi:MAG: hypothetical protein Q4B70_06985 [Lachnospiraceae bacterium]|nr:hypothetical protein [Lachnospiraceae bacterium]
MKSILVKIVTFILFLSVIPCSSVFVQAQEVENVSTNLQNDDVKKYQNLEKGMNLTSVIKEDVDEKC